MTNTKVLGRAHVSGTCDLDLVAELDRELDLAESALTVLFCSSTRDRDKLQSALAERASGSPVIGCTTAGEIGSEGFSRDAVSGMSFAKSDFKVSVTRLSGLQDLTTDDTTQAVTAMMKNLAAQVSGSLEGKCFALLLIDGIALAEEPLTYKLQHALGDIPLVGGSAGDDLEFEQTHVLCDGKFWVDSAVVALVYTERPWEAFKEQHFSPSKTKAVVTEADPDNRIVVELNAEPAAEEFARMLGLSGPEELNAAVFASNPLMVQLGGSWYIRSVQKANEDGSLTIYCAIDEGMVLCLGTNEDLVEHMDSTFSGIRERLGEVQATVAFDCIQRRQELENKQHFDRAAVVLERNR